MLATMSKNELRAACRANGISYKGMNNDMMRDALHLAGFAAVPAEVVQEEIPAVVVQEVAPEVLHPIDAQPLDQQPIEAVPGIEPVSISARVKDGVEIPVGKGSGIKIEKNRETRNGITAPSKGGVCAAIWAFLQEAHDSGMTPSIGAVKLHAASMGWDLVTTSIQYYVWRKFNGITGRLPKASAVAVAEA